mgnify:CR=1 FL=1
MAIDFDKIDRSVDLKGLQADVEDAKKNLVKIPVINGTIPHKQEQRFGGSLVMIRPAAPGTVSSPAVPCVRAGVGGHQERARKEQGLVEPPQPGEGNHRRLVRTARRSQHRTSARYLDGQGV